MSTATTTAETVTGAPVTEATEHASASADEHTPVHVEPREDATDATRPDDALDAIRESVTQLATAVAVLTDTVSGMGHRDENPVHSVPWTHRGGPVHHEDE